MRYGLCVMCYYICGLRDVISAIGYAQLDVGDASGAMFYALLDIRYVIFDM